ncbi:unnamed protein product [Durusdinium trenchii]|uniref:non-specific serine/threonine protein kinase n=2 Tax=Durusdinium trenchii TaxID=1381693 RepID=A0ABP0R3J2_9DINO
MNLLSSYKIGRCISRGHASRVNEATYLETCAVVAVKRVTHDLDDRLQKECETEITILQMLDHPNLIKYHTHFTFHGDLFLVMELATGGTLANRIEQANQQEKLIEEHLVWRWLNDVSSALAYLHKRRVLHRDVKPSHIFIGETGQAKLGDFGLSKAFSDATTCAMSCVGTPLYMSPEIVRGEGYSFGSDIWSLGCSLYELAAGLPPFYRTDMDFVALGHAICSAEYPELPSDVWSKEFLSIVSQILTVDPTQRPSAQMIFDLAGCRLLPRIHDFQIIGAIGRGQFSEVHRALWKAGGDREVALKRIQIDEMNDHARREVYAEAKILQELSHATIIKYFDSFTEDNEMVIILELAAHGDLSSLLSKQKHMDRLLEEHQVWGIFFQIGEALHHMHRQRIMHRDIKPENTFICHRGVVKLGDLGLGRFFGSNTYKAHSVVGTPFYMSPEVISDSGGYSFKSDIWSMGCVLYQLYTLRSPFAGPGMNYYMLGHKINRAEYPPLPAEASQRVAKLCSEILQVEQDARPDSSTICALAGKYLNKCLVMHPTEKLVVPEGCSFDDPQMISQCLQQAAQVVQELLNNSGSPRPPRSPPKGQDIHPPSVPRPERPRGGYISVDNRRFPSAALEPLLSGTTHTRSDDAFKPLTVAPGRARSPRTLLPITRHGFSTLPSQSSRANTPHRTGGGSPQERGLGSSQSAPARPTSPRLLDDGLPPVGPLPKRILAPLRRAPSPRTTRLGEQGVLLTPRESLARTRANQGVA